MNDPSTDDLLRLAWTGVNPVRILRLLHTAQPSSVIRTLETDPTLCASARMALETPLIDVKHALSVLGVKFVAITSDPGGVPVSGDAPAWLFVRGSLPAELGVAVVGSRRASSYGLRIARDIGAAIGASGVPVISGLALGIDGAAHRGCVRAGGSTVAVLGSGIDLIYPARHRSLADEILGSGCGAVVSEYPPGARPEPWRFPLRNRIIAGSSRAVVVVEAAEKSGALITARLALDLGLDVFAVPGDLDRATSAGTNRLIRDGAHPVTSMGELSEALELGVPPLPDPVGLDIDVGEQLTVDQLAARHPELQVPELMATIADLELRGLLLVDGGLIEVPRGIGAKS